MFQLALAASVVLFAPVKHAEVHDDLEPCMGVFSWVEPPDPYYLAVRAALLDEHPYRKCQVVAIPSFEREWGVYLARDEETPPSIVFKRLRKHLWSEMNVVLEAGSIDGSYSLRGDAQAEALQRIDVKVERFEVAVSEATADVLEGVWREMLRRVRYAEGSGSGYDGVSYHVAHWEPGKYRSGETWSPDEGTRTAALVKIAEAMGALAEAPPAERRMLEVQLATAASELAKRLEQLKDADRDR